MKVSSINLNLLVLSSIVTIVKVSSMVQCSMDDGGGVCPDKAKCCRIKKEDGSLTSGCIPDNNHIKGDRVCCEDSSISGYYSGCAGSFKCIIHTAFNGTNGVDFMCALHEEGNVDNIEQVSIMPRYHMVEASKEELTMYGYPLIKYSNNHFKDSTPIIAYYSNMDWSVENKEVDNRLQHILFVIHGSGRNADDYVYSGMVAAESQKTYPLENILIIAPRFLADEDGIEQIPVKYGSTNNTVLQSPLLWNERKPIPHTWRYGANAIAPFANISSYDVMDHLVEHFAFNSGFGNRYSSLEGISVIGHSAGGQFTQRWALTSNSQVWQDYQFKPVSVKSRKQISLRSNVSIRAVVANPRSFCYLDGRRYIHNGPFQTPPQSIINKCPTYNTWEWGLDDGGFLPTPYKDLALALFDGDTVKLAHRYAQRDVVYLSGANDIQKVRGSCEDDKFQGKNRRERSENFYRSLKEYFGYKVHVRSIIEYVGHDHSLIFGSKQGISAIFGA